jgi:hypothetical protein
MITFICFTEVEDRAREGWFRYRTGYKRQSIVYSIDKSEKC